MARIGFDCVFSSTPTAFIAMAFSLQGPEWAASLTKEKERLEREKVTLPKGLILLPAMTSGCMCPVAQGHHTKIHRALVLILHMMNASSMRQGEGVSCSEVKCL